MQYIKYKCNNCGKYLYTYYEGVKKYGTAIGRCKNCDREYLDLRYREIDIKGIQKKDLSVLPYLIGIAFGVLAVWRCYYLSSWEDMEMPKWGHYIMLIFIGLLGVAIIVFCTWDAIEILTGKKKEKYEKKIEESRRRIRDESYMEKLKKLGYDFDD